MKRKAPASVVPQLEFLEPRQAPSASPWLLETFNSIALGSLPGGWSQWSSSGTGAFGVISTSTANGMRLAISAWFMVLPCGEALILTKLLQPSVLFEQREQGAVESCRPYSA